MSEHIPRLFTPPILENHKKQDDITIPTLQTIIKTQLDIIDKQSQIINRHEYDINDIKTSLQDLKLLLTGRQFMNRSVSFESNESETTF